MSALAVKDITKSFGGVRAVDHIDIVFEQNAITGIIGPNGSGKSTFVNLLTGIIPFDSGMVVVSDAVAFKKIRSDEAMAYGITRTFQNVRLIQQMSVLDNVLVVLTERNVWGALFERHNKVHLDMAEDVLRRVGLWEKRNEHAANLSYGQRKLLEVARATSMNAKIYLFDEPFAGLFSEMRKTVSGILRELRGGGAAVVLIEHNMDLIRELADVCYVLDSGKVIAHGTPDHVLRQEHVIEAYLGK